MTPLPPVVPVTGLVERVRVGRDYSVYPWFIGRFVDVTCTLTQVSVYCQVQPARRHERCWASGRTVTDREHVAVAKGLRSAYGAPRRTVIFDDLQSDLAVYDAAFGGHLDTPVSA